MTKNEALDHAYVTLAKLPPTAGTAIDAERRAAVLYALRHLGDEQEGDHESADELLLELIGDPDITEAFKALPRWYA